MSFATSHDGTQIAYTTVGAGPVVVLVDGAMCYRAFGPMPALSALLATDFTVVTYDRRGRGESGDQQPFAVQREVEDLAAVIEAVGGSAFVYAVSSGAALALEAALQIPSMIRKLALYEAPYNADPADLPAWREYVSQLELAIADQRFGDAPALFMAFVGTPPEQLAGMRQSPMWPLFEAIAPTLAYDAAVLGREGRAAPLERVKDITMPTLVMNGDSSYPFMHETGVALAQHIPNAHHRVLAGQTHDLSADVAAPILKEFFS
ncbi:MAG: alpha/beta hydrolase [Anaerolineae bacterium]|jgi:pimeloyl-ACP methyl ester carboxylesterase|nr:alpha/beta hydrolase [Anaerolineae bacterium]